LTPQKPTAIATSVENSVTSRRWSGRSADVKIDTVGPVGGDRWEVSFSDRGILPSKGGATTCEKFQVSRARVENLIVSLSSADRNGKKECEREYRQQWNELRKGGNSERVSISSGRRAGGIAV
jgi:hypothetical protein